MKKSVTNIAISLGIYRKTHYLSVQSIYYNWNPTTCRDPRAILMRRSPLDKGVSAGLNMAAPMLDGARNQVAIFPVVSIIYEKVKHSLNKGG